MSDTICGPSSPSDTTAPDPATPSAAPVAAGTAQALPADAAFREVPRTGVIYVMGEARSLGYRYGHPDWANLGQGAPETGPLDGSAPRLETVDVDPRSHEYAPVTGLRDLREAVATLYNARYRRGMRSQYTYENVAISAGGRAGLTRVAAGLGPINLGHLLPDYTAYEELLDVFRAFVPIPIVLDAEGAFRLTPELLRREIVGRGLGAVLMSNPCNPTGQVLRGGALRACVDTGRQLGCAMVFDEFYAHYLYDPVGDEVSVSAARFVEDVDRDPIVILDGLTKNWRYPGLRLSWTVGPKPVIERVASAGSFLDGGAPHPLQRAAVPLVTREVADREARAIQATFGAKRDLVLSRCRDMGLTVPSGPAGAFYAFVGLDNLPPGLRDGMAFFRAALERQVICVPGEFFDVNPGKRRSHIPSRLKGFVRLSFGPDMAQLRLGLDRLDALVRSA